MSDPSNGYESIAATFLAGRGSSDTRETAVGVDIVRAWTKTLRPGGAVLDLGCGPGDPITRILVDSGFTVYGVDASPAFVDAFQSRFPGVPIECNTVERSTFFGREFDGVIAWGLIFLLEPDAQAMLIDKVARVLVRDGRFVFTAPRPACTWDDAMTGRRSESLGRDAYLRLIESAGLVPIGESEDDGDNHYFMSRKP